MKTLGKKKIICIVSIFLAVVLLAVAVAIVWICKMPRPLSAPRPYYIPAEFSTNFTEEEHKQKIYERATAIAESIDYTGEIKYDVVYNKLDQPRYFIVEFEEVVCLYVGKEKRTVQPDAKDQYIYTRVLYGAIIEDEYYIMKYGLGEDLEGAPPTGYDAWKDTETIMSTPPSIYTLLDVWDCKKYLYNLYQEENSMYCGKYELVAYDLIHTETSGKDYYVKKYGAKAEQSDLKGTSTGILKMNPFTNYNYATSLDQAYVFKVYEK